MEQHYLKVTPSDAQYDPAVVPDGIIGLHDITSPEPDGWLARLNPFMSSPPPRFEFTAVSAGEDAPVEFIYGVDEPHLETLERLLTDLYPDSFDITSVETEPAKQLVTPVEYEPEEFVTALDDGRLWVDRDEVPDAATIASDGGVTADHGSTDMPVALEQQVADPRTLPTEEPLTTLDRPTRTTDGSILARPAPDDLLPVGYRWHGVGERKRDWMCKLTTFTEATGADRPQSYRQEGGRRPPLAPVIDHLGDASIPLAFQVVFRREPNWKADAGLRVADLKYKRETLVERIGAFLFNTDLEKRDLDDLPTSYRKRITQIEDQDPQYTFAATIRALTVPQEEGEDARSMPQALREMRSLLSTLNGRFYKLEPTRFRKTGGFRAKTKDAHARTAFERFRNRDLLVETDDARHRPQVVVTADELASFMTVPSATDLSVEAQRETRSEDSTRNPLPRPNPRLLREFDRGMAIGKALDDVGDPVGDPIRVPPRLLTRHYARLAASGHGKSVAVINDLLSIHDSTDGPSVLIDRKGEGMCTDYMRVHFAEYGDLEDVVYFRIPEMLPAVPFFDIRPALAAGRDWETAVQDRVEHFRELLRLVMGEQTHDRAYLANDILGFLIKAMFDPEYGQAAFGIDELYAAVVRMQRDQLLPPVSMDNIEIEETLANFFEKQPSTIESTLTAMEGRVNKLKDQLHIYRMLSATPEWDPEREQYVGRVFDFREFLDKDVVLLFDIGDLRPRGQRALAMALLSNLWDSIQPRGREDRTGTDHALVNLIIEEAAPLVTSPLLYEDLIPQGRSFGVSLGFVMQYPEQVSQAGGRDGGQRAYDELLNNVDTKIAGRIPKEDDLSRAMAGGGIGPEEIATRLGDLPPGEWIADLPDPLFRETGATPFSVSSLAIPEGHPEKPLSPGQESVFTHQLAERLRLAQAKYGLKDSTTSDGEPVSTSTDADASGSAPAEANASASATDASDAPPPEADGDPERDDTEFSSTDSEIGPSLFETFIDEKVGGDQTPSGDSSDSSPPGDQSADGDGDRATETIEPLEPGFDGDRPPDAAQSQNDGGDREPRPSTAEGAVTDDRGVPESDPDSSGSSQSQGGVDTDIVDDEGVSVETDSPSFDTFVPEDGSSDGVNEDPDEKLGHLNPEQRLLKTILDAMNRDLEGYSLVESMAGLVNRHEDADVDRLLEDGYLESHRVCRRDYYTVTPKGRRYLRESLQASAGVGDLGEKTPHKVGVELLRHWLLEQEIVEEVAIYFEHEGVVFDVVAFDQDASLVWVGEVETKSNDRESVRDDYEKLAQVDADAIWLFNNLDAALDSIAALADDGYLPERVTGRAARTYDGVRKQVTTFDADGLTSVRGYSEVDTAIDP